MVWPFGFDERTVSDANRFNPPAVQLVVYAAKEIPEWTLFFRSYFDAAYCADTPYFSPSSAARFAEIACVNGNDSRIVSFLHQRENDGEYPIKEVRVDQFDWLQNDNDESTQWFVARSFHEFIRRSFAYMIETDGAGFDFWQPTVRG